MNPRRICMFTIDLFCITAAFCVSVFFRQSSFIASRFGYVLYDSKSYLTSFIIAALFLLLVFSAYRLYQIRQIELSARIFTVLKALLVWILIIAACVYALKFDFSRGILFSTAIFTAAFICVGRYMHFRYRQNKKKRDRIDIHIMGTGNRADDIERLIKDQLPNVSASKLDINDQDVRSSLSSIESEEIFIADERLTREQVMEILADETIGHHSFRVILDTFRLVIGEFRLNNLDEVPSISPSRKPNLAYFTAKRWMDIIISGLGMIATLPLWLSIAAMVRLDSKGPVIIKQTRVGFNHKLFTLYKFRTMRCDAPLYGLAPSESDDGRVTRVGKILRRFSLDELPQLWNIFKGDMSLVGPRPEMEFIVKNYQPWQRTRLKVKPGLTGLWQILGRKNIPLHENLEYDFYYVSNQSLILDSVILLKTIPAVLFGRGAY